MTDLVQPGATIATSPPSRPSAAESDKKTAHHLRNLRLIMVSYSIDGLVLLLFCLAGTIGWQPVIGYTATGLAITGATYVLIATGRTRRLKDPALIIPHTIASQALQLAALALVPEVGFMFALLLFIVYGTLTLTLDVRRSLLAWILVTLGTVSVLAGSHQTIRIPDANLFEQLVAYGFFVITLWRCVWIGTFNSQMTALLHKRGEELAELTAQVDQLAHHDELTGLLNRRSLFNALRDEIQRAQRSRAPMCIALMDLDRFKSINDTLGHLVGDRTLRLFASTLAPLTRKSDCLGRYGGEEFLLVMTAIDAELALVPVQRMHDALAAADWSTVSPGLKAATFSCGIAALQPGDTAETLLKRADEALYRAKAEGRNCTRVG